MKIITEAGIEIQEDQIDVEYAKTLVMSLILRISNESESAKEALKHFASVQRFVEREVEWKKTLVVFEQDGYTGKDVAAYLDSRENHDPMDDDPHRDRNPI